MSEYDQKTYPRWGTHTSLYIELKSEEVSTIEDGIKQAALWNPSQALAIFEGPLLTQCMHPIVGIEHSQVFKYLGLESDRLAVLNKYTTRRTTTVRKMELESGIFW